MRPPLKARPSRLYSLSLFHLLVRAQIIAPLQEGTSLLGGGSPLHAPPACVAIHNPVRQAIGAVFFRRSRLFFREAAFFSGGEGCEWRACVPPWAREGKSRKTIFGFFLLDVPRRGFSPHIPAPRLFVLFHPTKTISQCPQTPPSHPKIGSFPIGIAFRAHHP